MNTERPRPARNTRDGVTASAGARKRRGLPMPGPACRDAARLLSRQIEQPLPTWQRLGLRIHLLLCTACRRYARQLRWTRTQAQRQEMDQETKTRLRHDLEAEKH